MKALSPYRSPRRAIALFLLLVMTAAALLSCSGEDEEEIPSGMEIGERTSEYTFYIPQGWILQPAINGVALACATETDQSSVSLYACDMPAMSIDEYWTASSEQLSRYEGFTLTSKGQVSFGNDSAQQYEFAFKHEGTDYKAYQCLAVNGGRVYTMTYLAKATVKPGSELSYYDYNFEYAESVRRSFKIAGSSADSVAKAPFEDKNTPEGMMLISDTSIVEYKLYVPTDWQIDMQTGYTCAYVSDTDRSSVGVSYCAPSNGERSIAEYHATIAERYRKIYTSYEEIGEPATVGEGEYQFLVYRYNATYAGKEISVMQAFILKGFNVYTVTYTAPRESFDTHLDTANNIIKEFRFK